MQDLPLISVIVPVYKVEAYLDHCIQSLVSQTYSNLEILLVDDGSPDRSGAICDEWAARDKRIKVIHKENGGAGKARNVALDQAKGELIGFVDSDDYISPRMYEYLYGLMQGGIDIAECVGIPTEGDDCPLDEELEQELTEATASQAMYLNIQEKLFTQVIWNKLYRRQVIEDIRFPEGNLIDDEFFTYRTIGKARKLVHSSRCMYAYRQQASSVMHKPYSLRRLQGIEAHRQRLEYLKENMPELVYDGKVALFFASVYAWQMSLLWLSGPELETARKVTHETVLEITPLGLSRRNSYQNNIWLVLGQISFDGLCRFLNFLESRDR